MEAGVSSPLQSIRTAVDFLAEAAVEQVRMTATTKGMSHSVTACRALWLKNWSADNASIDSLFLVPFDRKLLLGKALESAIQRVSGGKSGLIPQERRKPSQSFCPSKRSKDRLSEATAYRPGRPLFKQ